VIFGQNDILDVPANFEDLCDVFEKIEAGSSNGLKAFLEDASIKYKVGMEKLVYKPGLSLLELVDIDLVKGVFKLQVLTSFTRHVKKYFKHPKLIALMEFPVLFLGAMPEETPALYSLMNYAGLKLGTWYPEGGFDSVIQAMKKICERQGVRFHLDEPVINFEYENGTVWKVKTSKTSKAYDAVVAAADYHHVEEKILVPSYRNYSESYWNTRVLAPSCLIFYLGVTSKISRLRHHNLFFDADLKKHAHQIYKDPQWPSQPLFYVCCPSRSDSTVAPPGHDNIFILMPLAAGLKDNPELREQYFEIIMSRIEAYAGERITDKLDYKKSYCINDFRIDYNAYKGNAYGLANTLKQTANLKPSVRNKKLKNLFYAGQLTVPGPGVPPSIISGKVAAQQVLKYFNS
jgi:phytoene desaturase